MNTIKNFLICIENILAYYDLIKYKNQYKINYNKAILKIRIENKFMFKYIMFLSFW